MFLVLVTILETGFSVEKLNTEFKEEQVSAGNVSNTAVILGGMPIGIYMKTEGVLVLGTDKIENCEGISCEPAKNIVKAGDYIVGMNGLEIESKNELIKAVERLKSPEVILTIRRAGEVIQLKINAVRINDDNFKLGIWVKDSTQGLGTITYLTQDGRFGALGHGIYDSEKASLLEMKSGKLYNIDLIGITKGKKGTPGGIEGVIFYNTRNYLGNVEKNSSRGIYGTVENVEKFTTDPEIISIAKKKEIKLGEATIRCTIEDCVEEYCVEIEQIDYFPMEENKGMIIRITDERLLEKTGGIVQGMSGSPIIQDGKLVGAVTHVLVNDPTRGYGIFIENMLDAAG